MTQLIHVDVPRLLIALGIEDFKQDGSSIWAACPYPGHEETKPSWHIQVDEHDPQRNGLNHCFGCKEGGSALHLALHILGTSGYGAARRWIEEKGLTLDAPKASELRLVSKRQTHFGSGMPSGSVVAPLESWPTPYRRYAQSRGITDRQVDRWGLAYGAYGAAQGRIIIPTRDAEGNLLSWTARATRSDQSPRYRNASAKDGHDPSAVFGEQYWSPWTTKEAVVVTEGAINAMACERVGAPNIAALSGSRLDAGQILRISRFGRVVLALDPDQAGERVAAQACATLSRWKKVTIVNLPRGLDPRDVEARDPDELRSLLNAAFDRVTTPAQQPIDAK